jgi:hypothetical protein
VPGEGVEPTRAKGSQDFKGGAGKSKLTETTIFINHLGLTYLGWGGVELGGFGLSRLQYGYSDSQTGQFPVSRLYVHVTVFRPEREAEVIFIQ